MNTIKQIEKKLESLGESIGSDDSLVTKVMSGIDHKTFCSPSKAFVLDRVKAKFVAGKMIMCQFSKVAVAAVFILGAVWMLNFIGGPNMASVAWADVAQRVAQVDYVHFYEIIHRGNSPKVRLEGWYSQGKVMVRKSRGGKYFLDDGNTETVFGNDGVQMRQGPSRLAQINGETFFDKITHGLLHYDNEQFLENMPDHVGDDFLIYRFEPPKRMEDWVESISITVGKYSLLPIQMKVFRTDQQEGSYDLSIFDYEAPEKTARFFDPQNLTSPPHGKAKVKLNNDEKTINLSDSPGIKALTIRVYSKDFGNAGPLNVFDAAIITTENFKRTICRQIPLEFEKEIGFGIGSSEHWPDGKFRYVNVQAKFNRTESDNVYLVEVNCWSDFTENYIHEAR